MPITPSERVEAFVRETIYSGEIRPGGRLPPELDLARDLDVSPVTVRRAIAHLRSEGYIETRSGRGTYVRSRPIPHRLQGDAFAIAQRSQITAATQPASERVATLLSVVTGTELHIRRWTESIDDQRIALVAVYSIDPASDERSGDDAWTELVRARLPTNEEMEALGIADITPVLSLTRTSARPNGRGTVVDRVSPADRVELVYRPPQRDQ